MFVYILNMVTDGKQLFARTSAKSRSLNQSDANKKIHNTTPHTTSLVGAIAHSGRHGPKINATYGRLLATRQTKESISVYLVKMHGMTEVAWWNTLYKTQAHSSV